MAAIEHSQHAFGPATLEYCCTPPAFNASLDWMTFAIWKSVSSIFSMRRMPMARASSTDFPCRAALIAVQNGRDSSVSLDTPGLPYFETSTAGGFSRWNRLARWALVRSAICI